MRFGIICFLLGMLLLSNPVRGDVSDQVTHDPVENGGGDSVTASTSFKNNRIRPFDKLIGTWNVTQSIRNREGTWSVKPEKYQWRFYPILEGEAVQDDWIKIDSTGTGRVTGTNIRIFNADENRWHMAWIDRTNRRTAVFTARNKGGDVIMEGTNAKGRPVRITFTNITKVSFDWVQEWTFDDGESWVEVSRIRASRE